MAKEDTCTQPGQKVKRSKGVENKKKKGKEQKDREKKERDRKEKEEKRQMLSTRVENLVEKMTDSSVDDRFSSGLIDQCCQILSVPNASSSEDSDADENQHQVAELREMIKQQEARKHPQVCVPVRQQKPPPQRLQPTLPSAYKSVQKQPMGRHQFTSIFGQPLNTSRPTVGMKQPRKQPVYQAINESEDDEDFECSKCKKFKQENDQLKKSLEEILQNKGMCTIAMATACNIPATFVHKDNLTVSQTCQT